MKNCCKISNAYLFHNETFSRCFQNRPCRRFRDFQFVSEWWRYGNSHLLYPIIISTQALYCSISSEESKDLLYLSSSFGQQTGGIVHTSTIPLFDIVYRGIVVLSECEKMCWSTISVTKPESFAWRVVFYLFHCNKISRRNEWGFLQTTRFVARTIVFEPDVPCGRSTKSSLRLRRVNKQTASSRLMWQCQ